MSLLDSVQNSIKENWVCLIVINSVKNGERLLPGGAYTDATIYANIMRQMGFQVKYGFNSNLEKYLTLLEELSKCSKIDVLSVAIFTHGNADKIYFGDTCAKVKHVVSKTLTLNTIDQETEKYFYIQAYWCKEEKCPMPIADRMLCDQKMKNNLVCYLFSGTTNNGTYDFGSHQMNNLQAEIDKGKHLRYALLDSFLVTSQTASAIAENKDNNCENSRQNGLMMPQIHSTLYASKKELTVQSFTPLEHCDFDKYTFTPVKYYFDKLRKTSDNLETKFSYSPEMKRDMKKIRHLDERIAPLEHVKNHAKIYSSEVTCLETLGINEEPQEFNFDHCSFNIIYSNDRSHQKDKLVTTLSEYTRLIRIQEIKSKTTVKRFLRNISEVNDKAFVFIIFLCHGENGNIFCNLHDQALKRYRIKHIQDELENMKSNNELNTNIMYVFDVCREKNQKAPNYDGEEGQDGKRRPQEYWPNSPHNLIMFPGLDGNNSNVNTFFELFVKRLKEAIDVEDDLYQMCNNIGKDMSVCNRKNDREGDIPEIISTLTKNIVLVPDYHYAITTKNPQLSPNYKRVRQLTEVREILTEIIASYEHYHEKDIYNVWDSEDVKTILGKMPDISLSDQQSVYRANDLLEIYEVSAESSKNVISVKWFQRSVLNDKASFVQSLRDSFRRGKDSEFTANLKVEDNEDDIGYGTDEYKFRRSFMCKFLGERLVDGKGTAENTGVILKSFKTLKQRHKQRVIINITPEVISIVSATDKSMRFAQAVDKIYYCAPDNSYPDAFSYIAFDGVTQNWSCFCFSAMNGASGASVSIVICEAFRACLRNCQRTRKQNGKTPIDIKETFLPDGAFLRKASFRQSRRRRKTETDKFSINSPQLITRARSAHPTREMLI